MTQQRKKPTTKPIELLPGTLDILILRALEVAGPQHGYGVMRWIRQATEDGLQIEEGALYPALHRILAKGWVSADWGLSENNRQAKFYTLTAEGRRQLELATHRWRRYVEVMNLVLEAV